MFAPILFVISVSIVSTSTLSSLLVLVLSILLFLFFSGPRNVACSESVPGLLAKFING